MFRSALVYLRENVNALRKVLDAERKIQAHQPASNEPGRKQAIKRFVNDHARVLSASVSITPVAR